MPKLLFMKSSFFILLSFAWIGVGCKKDETKKPQPQLFAATGNINATLDQFRQALGVLNTQLGAATGRREITWEIVPDSLLDKKLPSQFFNQTGTEANAALQRGLAYEPGTDLRVSKTNFAAINAQAATEFAAFSGTATFANTSSNLWPVLFQVAGTTDAAASRGFGMVVSDVDNPNTVQLEFFNGAQSLGKVSVPPHSAGSSFSFAGILFDEPVITRVQVTHEGFLANGEKDISQGGSKDLVVMDDFIYGEPVKK